MRILLLGTSGQLGWELQRTLAPLGDLIALDYPQIDLSHPDRYHQAVKQARADILINATAYTAVDQAESETELSMAINAIAPGILAEIAQDSGAALIHYSTDYVFDGTKESPYIETDPPNPLNAYGQSKLAGEKVIEQVNGAGLILRTSWVYSLRRDSFVTKVLRWSRLHEQLRVVTDQISKPTWARMLAQVSAMLLAQAGSTPAGWLSERRGIYHLAGGGEASRLDWAQAILEYDPHPEEQVTKQILPAETADFPTPAQRPLYSVLNCDRFYQTFGLRLPEWRESLRLAMVDLCEYKNSRQV
jgi:dTDP-4-dehydrorhamnose reductase